MQHNKIVSIFGTVLLLLAALTILIPTDATGAVRSKTASVSKSPSKDHVSTTRTKVKRRNARHSGRRSRKSCNTTAGVKQAIELVRTQSADLCKLAGLEYVTTGGLVDSVRASLATDEGELDEPEIGMHAALGKEVTNTGMSPEDEADHAQELLEQEAEDDVLIGEESFRSLWLSYVDGDGSELTEAGVEKQKLVDMIMQWLGTRYHFGGTSSSGIDCSAFVREMYASTAGIELPRTASEQNTVGVPISKPENLQLGDLVFFNTRRRVRVGHVGIYLGDHLFAHASSRFGVTISSLESTYYNKRFIGGTRLDQHSVAQLTQTVPGL